MKPKKKTQEKINKNKKVKRYRLWLFLFIIILPLSLLSLLLLQGNCAEKDSGHVLSNIEDAATFIIYYNELPTGKLLSYIDLKGNYHSKITGSIAGQKIEATMDIRPDPFGDWKTINIDNPLTGAIQVKRVGNEARYYSAGKKWMDHLPEKDYTIHDNFGILLESVMLKKYDMKKKRKQLLKCYYIHTDPSIEGTILVKKEMEWMKSLNRTINGTEYEFLIFNYTDRGLKIEYWLDKNYKIYMIHSAVNYKTTIREGFEELLPFKTTTAELTYEKKTAAIPMRDGIKLITDLYMPGKSHEKKKYPVVLIRTPYKKDIEELNGRNWAKKGYVCAIQDVRGRFASPGTWEPFVNEAEDGYDTIEWLAAREWSTGKVGMIGGSYMGLVQLQAASVKPPHLVTIIPNVAPHDPFHMIFNNGIFRMWSSLWWTEILETGASADITGKQWLDSFKAKGDKFYYVLPVINLDKKLFAKEIPYWRKWIQHNTYDSYWQKVHFQDKLQDLDIPVFLQSGWYDGNSGDTITNYLRLKQSKNKYIKMIMGPWDHADKSSSRVGEIDMGEEAGIDLLKLYQRWFDYWLKGIDTRILAEPMVQVYAMNSRQWLSAGTYPLPGTRFTPFYLSSTTGANSLAGDGKLQKELPPGDKPYDEYVYDPELPTPGPPHVFNFKDNEEFLKLFGIREDILIYTMEPLTEELTIAGPVSFVLYASSNAIDTDWFVEFDVIPPRGKTLYLTDGIIRARFRNSLQKPEFLEKDKIYKYTIDLGHTGITFEKGSLVRIMVTSAFYPMYSRNLNTGGHNELDTKYVKAKQRIYHTREYPSHLLLPLINNKEGK